MLVTLIGKNTIHKIALPQTPSGSYWLSDTNSEKERKLINIEAKNGKWQIASNHYVKIINSRFINISNNNIKVIPNAKNAVVDKITLREYGMYGICLGSLDELYILYCSPVYDNNILHLNLRNTKEFCIGSGRESHIIYQNKLVSNMHARIFYNNGRWMIENFDKRYGTFVNNKPVDKETSILSNGDVIFIMGLKIILMGNSIYMNNPQGNANYYEQYFELEEINNNIINVPKDEESNEEIELYTENDYFSKAPRITNIIEREKVKIDAPPQIQDKEETPMILTLGSTLSMGVMMMISMYMTIDGRVSGTATTKDTVTSLLMALAMLVSILVFPILMSRYEKKKKIRYEEKRQTRYKNYLNNKKATVNKIKTKQRNILYENYISADECTQIILQKSSRFWERKIEDYDFLTVRLGIGDVPLEVDIQYPEEQFAMEDDNLVEILKEIGNESKILKDAPIVTSLVKKNVSSIIVKDEDVFEKFMQNLIIQLITFHSYEDLKMVFLLKKENRQYWEYVKMLPHVWNNSKNIRFFTDDYDEMKEISKYLEEDLKHRLRYQDADYKSFSPYYLIITDDYKKIENLKIIKQVLQQRNNVGFSLLCVTEDLTQLPKECKIFISLGNKVGMLFENELSSTNQKQINFDTSTTIFFEKICQTVANIPIRYSSNSQMMLPDSYTFLQMYDAGLIDQLNILNRWNKNDSTLSLKTPIGIDGSGNQIILDIHEKFHGPHGLIAGSTGSRKK